MTSCPRAAARTTPGRDEGTGALIEPRNNRARRGLAVTTIRRLPSITQWWVRRKTPRTQKFGYSPGIRTGQRNQERPNFFMKRLDRGDGFGRAPDNDIQIQVEPVRVAFPMPERPEAIEREMAMGRNDRPDEMTRFSFNILKLVLEINEDRVHRSRA